jgi:hypothetical protein
MQPDIFIERRRDPRLSFSCDFKGTRISEVGFPDASAGGFRATLINVSTSGINLRTNHKLARFELVRGEIFATETAIGIPTLLKVVRVRETGHRPQYEVGLQFLI